MAHIHNRYLLRVGVAVLALFAATVPPLPAQSEAALPPRERVEIVFTKKDYIWMGIMGGTLLVAILAAGFVFVRKARALVEPENESASEFEAAVLGRLSASAGSLIEAKFNAPAHSEQRVQESGQQTAVFRLGLADAREGSQLPVGEVPPRIADAINRLRLAGLLDGEPQYGELHGNPRGCAFVPLKGARMAVVVGDFESAGFIGNQLRKNDLVILAPGSGPPIVVQPLPRYLNDAGRIAGSNS